MPQLEDLPYENPSFYRKLFKKLYVPEVVEIFTHLLFEESVLILAEDIEDLIPVIFAIKSFLYPLKIAQYNIVPNDGIEGYDNSLY